MSASFAGPFAAWLSGWFAGAVGPDDVFDAVAGGATQVVDGSAIHLTDVTTAWRRAGGARCVFPVPGDVRGLPGPAAFRAAALEAGEAVVGGAVGAVPELVDHAPSSAAPTLVWHVHDIEPAPPDHLPVVDAQYDLTEAVRSCASALAAAQVAGDGDPQAIAAARRAGEQPNLPPGFPPRAVALVAQAERMQAVLDLALADPVGGAVDRFGIAARTSALAPLVVAVRRARVAGYNAGARDETRL